MITQLNNNDITNANRDLTKANYSRTCPIALSLKRQGYKYVRVLTSEVVVDNEIYTMDEVGKKFLRDFDSRFEVAPCQVELTKVVMP